MVDTGLVHSWAGHIADIGPIYPFVGTEVFWFILGLVLWIVWHVVQSRAETRAYEEEIKRFGDAEGLKQALALEEADTSERDV